MAAGLLFVSCDFDDDSDSSVATKCNYEITVSVSDGAVDQQDLITTVVTFPNYDGEIQTKNISFANSWKATLASPITKLPVKGVITIKQSLKEGVDHSKKEEYKLGLSYKLVVFSMDAKDNIVDKEDEDESNNLTVPANNLNKLYPETITLRFSVDAKGEVSIEED